MNKDGRVYSNRTLIGDHIGYSTTYVANVTSTDATSLVAIGVPLPTNTANYFRLEVVAIQTGGSAGTTGDSSSFSPVDGLATNIAGTSTLVGSSGSPMIQAYGDAAAIAWTVPFAVDDATDTLNVSVTGEADKTINWTIKVEFLTATTNI